jgi:hypothetical protein
MPKEANIAAKNPQTLYWDGKSQIAQNKRHNAYKKREDMGQTRKKDPPSRIPLPGLVYILNPGSRTAKAMGKMVVIWVFAFTPE